MKKLFAMFLLVVGLGSGIAFAQTSISGDVAGTITDSTGAAVAGAAVKVTSVERGQVKNTTASANGQYRVPLLSPGHYTVEASAPGFEKTSQEITVSAGTVSSSDLKLSVGNQSTTVEVRADTELLHTDDAQISTSFTYDQVQSLPNPGNDMTFIAQTAPGSVMNTQGGYGNFSSFGLPATANTFTVNGGYENDPFLNLSNSGASNLLLGNNDIDTVTVVSPAYNASFGGLAGAQVNEISRSGSNAFHGNLSYYWNGSVMNANDWFNDNVGAPKGRSNSNQWAAAIGGPIKRDKAFFFVNTEGLRVIIPVRATIYAPSAAYQAAILNPTPYTDTCPDSGTPTSAQPCFAPYGNLAANGNSSQTAIYQNLFNFFNTANGAASAVPSASGDPRFTQFNGQGTNFASEWILTARTDLNITDNDKVYVHYKQDKGVQPTNTNLINPLFNANSSQPSYEGQAGWTHSIGANITNQLLVTGSYYRAIFENANQAEATAAMPLVFLPFDGDWSNNAIGTSNVGGEDYAFPQGRTVTGYQAEDDLTITKSKHTISLGWAIRRNDVTDYTPSEHTVGEAEVLDNGDFAGGYSDLWVQRFPTRLTQPLAVYNMGAYIQDQWKVQPNLTITAGLRLEHNSNPVCQTNCFSNLSTDFANLSTDPTTAYNELFASGRHRAYLQQQAVGVNPRFGFAYLPDSKTTIRGGFGMFTDVFPATIASDLDTNAPGVARFSIPGAAYGNPYTFDPADPASSSVAAAGSAQAFHAAYPAGGSYSSISAATGGLFSRPSFQATRPKVYLPTTEEWSVAVERQIDPHTVISATYVGNHSYHGAVLNAGANAYNASTDVAGLPDALPNGSLGTVSIYSNSNQSNYNGLVLSASRHSSWLTLQFNYAYSHALDLVSNGGFEAFGINPEGQEDPYDLSKNYGNADYDIRHYVSGSYILTIPANHGPKLLVRGWEVAGTVFHNSGLPFTVVDSNTVPQYYAGTLYANQLSSNISHSCAGASHAGVNATPCAIGTPGNSGAGFQNFDYASGFGQQSRNAFTGPGYTDTDLTLTKSFDLPFRESKIKLGAQFYNILNHPNFSIPTADVGAGPGTMGVIQSTVSTPTSILGSFLGGDASPRLIQLVGKFTF